MASRKCRLCNRVQDPYGDGTRRCRVCGAKVCPTCAKKRYQATDEIDERPKNDRDPGNDDQNVLPWRCEDCYMPKPTKSDLLYASLPPKERVVRMAIDLVDEQNPKMAAARKLGLLVAVRTYQMSRRRS